VSFHDDGLLSPAIGAKPVNRENRDDRGPSKCHGHEDSREENQYVELCSWL